MQDFIPADHTPVVFCENFEHAPVEVSLQRRRILEMVLAHKTANARIFQPFARLHLIPANMKVGIGEDPNHLSYKPIDKAIGRFLCGIDQRAVDAWTTHEFIGPGAAAELRIPDQPACCMPRHIELGYDSDAALPGVSDNLAHFGLCIKLAIGAVFRQAGKSPALHPESLIIRQMPVQYVHLHCCQGIDGALDTVGGNEVSRYIQRETAPGEAWTVVNRDCRNGEARGCGRWLTGNIYVLLHEL